MYPVRFSLPCLAMLPFAFSFVPSPPLVKARPFSFRTASCLALSPDQHTKSRPSEGSWRQSSASFSVTVYSRDTAQGATSRAHPCPVRCAMRHIEPGNLGQGSIELQNGSSERRNVKLKKKHGLDVGRGDRLYLYKSLLVIKVSNKTIRGYLYLSLFSPGQKSGPKGSGFRGVRRTSVGGCVHPK